MGNFVIVTLNRSKKPLPSNWPHLIVELVHNKCRTRHVNKIFAPVPAPQFTYEMTAHRPEGVVFHVRHDRHDISARTTADAQRHIIDQAIETLDVMHWPVVKPEQRTVRGQVYLNLKLPLRHNQIVNSNVSHDQRVIWHHYAPYRTSLGWLGVRTVCPATCDRACKQLLEELWPLMWVSV